MKHIALIISAGALAGCASDVSSVTDQDGWTVETFRDRHGSLFSADVSSAVLRAPDGSVRGFQSSSTPPASLAFAVTAIGGLIFMEGFNNAPINFHLKEAPHAQ